MRKLEGLALRGSHNITRVLDPALELSEGLQHPSLSASQCWCTGGDAPPMDPGVQPEGPAAQLLILSLLKWKKPNPSVLFFYCIRNLLMELD